MSAVQHPQPRAGVLDIEPYVPGKSSAPGLAKVFKLSSNETPLGPSPRAIAAYKSVAAHLEDYPDGSASELREAIGRAFGLDPERIVCGAGSDDLLNLIVEVSGAGRRDKAAKVATTRTMWVPAVNGTGAFGRWDYIEVRDPWDAKALIRKHLATSPPARLAGTR